MAGTVGTAKAMSVTKLAPAAKTVVVATAGLKRCEKLTNWKGSGLCEP